MADDDDSLLERIDEIDDSLDMGSEDVENFSDASAAPETAKAASSTRGSSPDITEALDYTEDPDEDEEDDENDDGEVEDEKEKSPEKSEEKDGEEGELEDGELEDGELEDSDEEEDEKEKPKRVPITAPSGGGGRLPIEVGSGLNDNRLSRPLLRGGALPPIRNQPYLPRRDEPSESSFDSFLLEAKKVMNGETDDERTTIPSLLDIPTHRPPVKDLGPQCIYPSRNNNNNGQHQQAHNQNNRFKRDAANQFQPKDTAMYSARGRTNSQNSSKVAPPPLMRRVESKSPPARGFSYSPTKFNAEDISSDSDEELFRKRSPKPIPMRKVHEKRKRSRSSSAGSSSSKATIPGVRSISSASSSDSDSSARRRRNRRRSRSSTRSRSRTYSPRTESPKLRHMKRKIPNDTSPIRRSSRSRSPPPYPPGAMNKYQKKKKHDYVVTGDIHSYKIPKRGGSSSRDAPLFKKSAQPAFLAGRSKTSSSSASRDEKKDKKRRRRSLSETPPPSSKRRKEARERSRSRDRKKSRDSKKRKREERAQTISDSDDSQSSYDSRKKSSRKSRKRSRKSPSVSSKSSRSRSTRSDSSRTASRSSRSGSSDDSSRIPLRYRQQGSPPPEEKMNSDDDMVPIKKEMSSPENSPLRQRSESPKSRSVSPEVTKTSPALSRSSSESPLLDATSPLDSLEGGSPPPPPPPPPPEEDSEDVIPPPPNVTVSETRKQLKERLARIEKSLEINSPETACE